jgi:mRNA interferase MazF
MARLGQLLRSATNSVGDPYCPDVGDIISLNFSPQAGREMAGRHFALVLSPRKYNQFARTCIVCPATGQVRGNRFEVLLPDDLMLGGKGGGCLLSDQTSNLSWQDRGSRFVCAAPAGALEEVIAKFRTLLPL